MYSRLFQLFPPACAAALLLAGCNARKAETAGPPPTVPVSTAVATEEAVPVETRAVGTVEAYSRVEVKSQISGQLLRVRFNEGANVNRGDLLFEIDPRPYQEALRQAEAAVSKDQAQLRQAQANLGRDQAQLKNAETDAARYEQLSRDGVAPVMQYEQFRTAADGPARESCAPTKLPSRARAPRSKATAPRWNAPSST